MDRQDDGENLARGPSSMPPNSAADIGGEARVVSAYDRRRTRGRSAFAQSVTEGEEDPPEVRRVRSLSRSHAVPVVGDASSIVINDTSSLTAIGRNGPTTSSTLPRSRAPAASTSKYKRWRHSLHDGVLGAGWVSCGQR